MEEKYLFFLMGNLLLTNEFHYWFNEQTNDRWQAESFIHNHPLIFTDSWGNIKTLLTYCNWWQKDRWELTFSPKILGMKNKQMKFSQHKLYMLWIKE